jgi:hypothetical protein
MGCPCRLPVEKYPESADWGPLFWRLLHGLAEMAGKQKDAVLCGDEIRLWIPFLITLKETIPCDICRGHYGLWLSENPPSVLEVMPYRETGEWIRKYLWTLHNRINEGNDKSILPLEKLSELYRGVPITNTWRALEPVMKRVILLNGVSLLSWKKWLAIVRRLQGIYG